MEWFKRIFSDWKLAHKWLSALYFRSIHPRVWINCWSVPHSWTNLHEVYIILWKGEYSWLDRTPSWAPFVPNFVHYKERIKTIEILSILASYNPSLGHIQGEYQEVLYLLLRYWIPPSKNFWLCSYPLWVSKEKTLVILLGIAYKWRLRLKGRRAWVARHHVTRVWNWSKVIDKFWILEWRCKNSIFWLTSFMNDPLYPSWRHTWSTFWLWNYKTILNH